MYIERIKSDLLESAYYKVVKKFRLVRKLVKNLENVHRTNLLCLLPIVF